MKPTTDSEPKTFFGMARDRTVEILIGVVLIFSTAAVDRAMFLNNAPTKEDIQRVEATLKAEAEERKEDQKRNAEQFEKIQGQFSELNFTLGQIQGQIQAGKAER